MIKGVSGVPGSGKTYFVVKEIAEKYFIFNKDFSEWQPSPDYPELTIFTNIKQFKLPCVHIDDYLSSNNIDFETFLTVPYFEALISKHPKMKYLILLDEAQKFFPSNYKNNDVLYFFQYHRHLGVDVYLTYQSWSSVSRKITDLLEFEIRAVRSSFKILNEFRYHFYAGMDKIGGTVRKTDKMIFALYKSFDVKSLEKPPHPARKLIFFIVLLSLLFFGGFHLFLNSFKPSKSIASASVIKTPPSLKKSRVSGGLSARPPAPAKTSSISNPEIITSTRIRLGGFWWGDRLIGIEFFGHVIPVQEFTYQFTANFKDHAVYAVVPDAVLAQIKPLQTGGFIKNSDNSYTSISEKYVSTEPRTGRAVPFVDDGKTGPLPLNNGNVKKL